MPNWIGKSAARLQAVSREEPYRVRLAQVPAAVGDYLYDQILHHIQRLPAPMTATGCSWSS